MQAPYTPIEPQKPNGLELCTPTKPGKTKIIEPCTPIKPKKRKFAHSRFGIDYINLHYGKVKFVPKNPKDSDYVLLINDHRKKDTVLMYSTTLNTETMPEIFKHGMQQAMEKNSQNEKCMTGAPIMLGGEYSEYASAVNMKKDAGLEPEDQELCDSTTTVANIMCKKFDEWLASVCIKENKTNFHSQELWQCIVEINHILVIRRKNTEDKDEIEKNTEDKDEIEKNTEDKDEVDSHDDVEYDSDYNETFI